jgi:hypothetical protein
LYDAEMLLGLHRHLTAYSVVPATSALGELQFAGKLYELAFRLRGSGVSPIARLDAIAVSAGIASIEARMMLLPSLEALGWVRVNKDKVGVPSSVEDIIPPLPQLLGSSDRVLDIVLAGGTQRAALDLLRATSLMPLERIEALQAAAAHGDKAAEEALRHLEAVNLVKVIEAADGRSAVFNPNIWADDEVATAAALRTADSRASREVAELLEEIQANPGIPQGQVHVEERWVDFAVSQGLVQRTVVATAGGAEQRFLFTPHLGRDAFGVAIGDASGHVRQLVGSMIYAMTYGSYKLRSGAQFVRALIRDGRAGDASPIGTDYPMLETAGIAAVVPGYTPGRFSLELRQTDVAEAALKILETRDAGTTVGSSSGLLGQVGYRHLEAERAKIQLAVTNPVAKQDRAKIIAALRQASRG